MKKVMKKRTGFTLVELLIVIIIIGILAGAMLLVAGSGTDKANATKIVSDMRSLKAAALMKWSDVGNWDWVASADSAANLQTALGGYMDRDLSAVTVAEYSMLNSSPDVYVQAKAIDPDVLAKLVLIKTESGLTISGDAEPVLMRLK
jgi:general secretion pathway protein G